MNSRMVVRRLMPRFIKVKTESAELELREILMPEMKKFQDKTLNTKNLKEPRNWLDFDDILVYLGLTENALIGFDNVYRSIRDDELKAGDEVKVALLLKLSSLGFICCDDIYCEQCIDEMLAFKGFADISKKSIYLIDTPLVKTKEFITKNIKDGFLGQALKNYAVFNSGAHTVRDYISSFLK